MDNLLRITQRRNDCAVTAFPGSILAVSCGSLTDFVQNNGYIVQFFAYPEGERMRLLAVVRNSHLFVLETEVEREFPSLTALGGQKFHMFEREIAEQYRLPPGRPSLAEDGALPCQ